jgi:hypothetical protein
MLRIPHCLDNRLIDGGKVVSLMHRPHFISQKHYFFIVSGTQGLVRPEGLGKFKISPRRVSKPEGRLDHYATTCPLLDVRNTYGILLRKLEEKWQFLYSDPAGLPGKPPFLVQTIIIWLTKQLWVRLTQQFFSSSSDVSATTCFMTTTVTTIRDYLQLIIIWFVPRSSVGRSLITDSGL